MSADARAAATLHVDELRCSIRHHQILLTRDDDEVELLHLQTHAVRVVLGDIFFFFFFFENRPSSTRKTAHDTRGAARLPKCVS